MEAGEGRLDKQLQFRQRWIEQVAGVVELLVNAGGQGGPPVFLVVLVSSGSPHTFCGK
jgi:hypothetical protein